MLVALLLAVCFADARERRVPNVLVLVILGAGMLAALLDGGLSTMGRAALSALLGLGIWLPLHAFGKMGAGDVKLFAAGAAWLTPWQVVDAALLGAFAGGVISVVWLIRQLGAQLAVMRVLSVVRHPGSLPALASVGASQRVPYAVSLSAGLVMARFGVSLLSG